MKDRIQYLDNLRAFAILMIILDHAVMIGYLIYYDCFDQIYSGMGFVSRIFCFLCYESSRLGVPLFMMITGALILTKDFSDEKKIIQFYKHNLLPLVVLNIVWVIIYYLIYYIIVGKFDIPNLYVQNYGIEFSVKDFFKQLTFQRRAMAPNMWYIPCIIGFYLFLPIYNKIINMDVRTLFVPLCISVLVLFIFTDLNLLLKIAGIDYSFTSVVYLNYSGGIYGVYITFGYLLYKIDKERFKKKTLLIVLFVLFTLSVSLMFFSYQLQRPQKFFSGNDSFLQLLIVSCLFVFAKFTKSNKFTIFLSKKSMALFLFHYPILLVLNYLLHQKYKWFEYGSSKYMLLLYSSTLFICSTLTCLIPKNKLISRFVFHISD